MGSTVPGLGLWIQPFAGSTPVALFGHSDEHCIRSLVTQGAHKPGPVDAIAFVEPAACAPPTSDSTGLEHPVLDRDACRVLHVDHAL